jgi:FtsP/CotA-like multicopper oxidase with cupredoxin domain
MCRWAAAAAAAALAVGSAAAQTLAGGTLDPVMVPKYVQPLVIPPAMPRTAKIPQPGAKNVDYYEIAVRQFPQQILPPGYPATTVWSYGSVNHPGSFNYPAFTIEAKWRAPVRVKWMNELVANPVDCFHTPGGPTQPGSCAFVPHLLPVDQTLHWANPPGQCRNPMRDRDCRGTSPDPYTGPVPMVVHLHGAETTEWSDGYPEAWYLPAASNLPDGYHTSGSFYDTFKGGSPLGDAWGPGSAVFQYANDQEATALWYHDHSLGMTRQNVYAGPAGFYLLRGGPGDEVVGTLPGPAPALGDPPGLDYYEIPVAIQDRSFHADGSLFYPDDRAFFEGLEPWQLQIPFIPDDALSGLPSDVSPIWNPEFFGNTLVTNGRTWPFLDTEPRRYRLRFLNGSQSRFLVLRLVTATDPGDPATWSQVPGAFWQIGAEQGFLPAPVQLDELLMGPAERADTIVDFGAIPVPPGAGLYLVNVGPDEPFGGGVPGVDFPQADPLTTGQVMAFVPVPLGSPDPSTPPAQLVLPAPPVLPAAIATRRITLNELDSATVFVVTGEDGNVIEVPADTAGAAPFGPTEALLGILDADGMPMPMGWADPTTENVAAPGDTEVWEIFNFTMDAHPIHIHLVQFQVVDRQALALDAEGMATSAPAGAPRPPEVWETGFKDTVIAYPGEVTRVKATFPLSGLFVWHCHILEHEDNEMMRPYCVGDTPACRQANMGAHAH